MFVGCVLKICELKTLKVKEKNYKNVCVYVCTCVCMCARVCACVCVWWSV